MTMHCYLITHEFPTKIGKRLLSLYYQNDKKVLTFHSVGYEGNKMHFFLKTSLNSNN